MPVPNLLKGRSLFWLNNGLSFLANYTFVIKVLYTPIIVMQIDVINNLSADSFEQRCALALPLTHPARQLSWLVPFGSSFADSNSRSSRLHRGPAVKSLF